MKNRLFLPAKLGEDSLYARIRDDPRGKADLERLESMWAEYRDHAPKDFERNLQSHFHQRWWEMYLTVGLVHLGFDVKLSPKNKGPDLVVDVGGSRVFIEAVAPKVGEKSDRVPDPIMDSVGDYPRRECLLRLAQGLDSKQKAFARYAEESIIQPRDACIIAISACDLNQFGSFLDWPCPAPIALLAGAGHMVVTLDGSRHPFCMRQKSINKNLGRPVDIAMYDREDFRVVSAVLYSKPDPLNAPAVPESSLSLFLNPRARCPVPHDMSVTMETWSERQRDTETIWTRTQSVGLQ
jgi:hypothetical protein